jgi:hypothetical protein
MSDSNIKSSDLSNLPFPFAVTSPSIWPYINLKKWILSTSAYFLSASLVLIDVDSGGFFKIKVANLC